MSAQGPRIAAVALSHSPQMAQDTEHRQGSLFRERFARVAKAVTDFHPTLVAYFGPDHMRALARHSPLLHRRRVRYRLRRLGDATGGLPRPARARDRPRAAPGRSRHRHRARPATCGWTTASDSPHPNFSVPCQAVPLIPVVINCVDRPLPTAARTAALGRAVGEFLRYELPGDERVLVIGSGGISHAPPSLVPGARDLTEEQRQRLITDNIARAAEAINPAWDRQFLGTLDSPDWTRLADLTAEDLAPAGTGGAEVRTWIAAAFASGTPLSTVVYEPVTEWITGMGIAASDTLSIVDRVSGRPALRC